MTKRQAIRATAKRMGIQDAVLEKHVNEFFKYVAEALVLGEEVWISPIGKLVVKELKNTKRRRLWLEPCASMKSTLKRNPIEVPDWYRSLGVVVEEEHGTAE
jgi:hypothetical protein